MLKGKIFSPTWLNKILKVKINIMIRLNLIDEERGENNSHFNYISEKLDILYA